MTSSDKKKALGQFMTTNYEYILQNIVIPESVKTIIEPFCGRGDLLKFIKQEVSLELYDIDPQRDDVVARDTLLSPPSYDSKYVLTNPPYLARNKATDKAPFDKFKANDLFKCFIISMIQTPPDGGIMIIPLNFLSSIRASDIALRRRFCSTFQITQINIFEERVFDDTSYTICVIQFVKDSNITAEIPIAIYPADLHLKALLNESNNFMIGGEVYKLPINTAHTITRLTKLNRNQPHTSILVKCIDDNATRLLGLEMVEPERIYIDTTEKLSSRTYATLVIDPILSVEQQTELVKRFNDYVKKKRELFHSLFLANYRESKDIARKRISFGLVYSICGYILQGIDDDALTEAVEQLAIA